MLAEDVGRRLENFFWRIWSSRRLLENINGFLVAAIFGKILEGGYIRTTPTQSPRASRSLGIVEGLNAPLQTPFHSFPSKIGESRNDEDDGDPDETETESPPSSKKRLPPRPAPIPKKSKQASPPRRDQDVSLAFQPGGSLTIGSYKTTLSDRNAYPQAGQMQAKPLERSIKTARFDADEVSPTALVPPTRQEYELDEEQTDAHSKGKQKPGRRKVAVVANTGSSKRRPIIRQKSSQSSSSSASMTVPSHMEPEPPSSERIAEGSSAADTERKGRANQSVSARRSLGSEDKAVEKQGNPPPVGSIHGGGRERLATFGPQSISRTRPLPSHTAFTSILKKPVAAAAASASYQAMGIMDVDQGSAGGQSRSFDAEAIADSDLPSLPGVSHPVPGSTGTVQALPRTKSQLTLLLQRDQKSSAQQPE